MERDLVFTRIITFAALALVFVVFLNNEIGLLFGLLIALIAAGLLTAVLDLWLRLSLKRSTRTESLSSKTDSDQTLMINFQRKLLDARSEKDVLDAFVQEGVIALGADGASFVPYDEYRLSLPPLFHGHIPTNALQTWSENLHSPSTRQLCKSCNVMHSGPGCVLLDSAPETSRVYCYPFSVDDRETGVFNFFYAEPPEVTENQIALINDLRTSAGKAVQSIRWRDQEIAAFRSIQTAPPKTDLPGLLESLLDGIPPLIDADFVLIHIPGGSINAPMLVYRPDADRSPLDRKFVEGVWQSIQSTGHSLSLESVTLATSQRLRSIFAAPLAWRNEEPLGVLLIGRHADQEMPQRHLALIHVLAGQAALLIQNERLMRRVEYQAVVDERTRLAREIHDGIAQTLAFLKIQTAQMQNYFKQGQSEKLDQTLQSNYRTLNDAYLDARQAIDNLRRAPDVHLREWLIQTALDFQRSSGLDVDVSQLDLNCDIDLPLNVQVQLIRMVQESLNNVRKHAQASQVWISGTSGGNDLKVEVRDDGVGFDSDHVAESSRYGLRGIRERADTIGAEFQIVSRPGQGTTIQIQVPFKAEAEK
jgi:two-component system nitrate/nitrite sensor histidine kinase NarX